MALPSAEAPGETQGISGLSSFPGPRGDEGEWERWVGLLHSPQEASNRAHGNAQEGRMLSSSNKMQEGVGSRDRDEKGHCAGREPLGWEEW